MTELQNVEGLLSRKDAARFLTANGYKTSPSTMAKWASWGTQDSPPFRRWGRNVVYSKVDLLAWARSKLSDPATTTSGHDDNAKRSGA
jgi:hypothetical protein